MSRKSQRVGSNWESHIETQHEMAKILGIIAHIEHNEPHTKVVRGEVRYVAPGVADWTGILVNGTAFAVEAKSTEKPKMPRAMISDKQAEHMDAVAHAGGLALLLAEFRETMPYRRYAIPWLEVPWKKKQKLFYLDPKDVDIWLIREQCYLLRWHKGGPQTARQRRVLHRV